MPERITTNMFLILPGEAIQGTDASGNRLQMEGPGIARLWEHLPQTQEGIIVEFNPIEDTKPVTIASLAADVNRLRTILESPHQYNIYNVDPSFFQSGE